MATFRKRKFVMNFLSKKQVCAKITLSPTHIGRLEDEGKFPKRHRLGDDPRYSRVVWVEEEIEAWMKARIAERDKATLP
jgi:predicted DNA-binding transcriptional regulator AlpA